MIMGGMHDVLSLTRSRTILVWLLPTHSSSAARSLAAASTAGPFGLTPLETRYSITHNNRSHICTLINYIRKMYLFCCCCPFFFFVGFYGVTRVFLGVTLESTTKTTNANNPNEQHAQQEQYELWLSAQPFKPFNGW